MGLPYPIPGPVHVDYAIEICSAVFDVIEPGDERLIMNLPATVEMYTPNLYADVIEYFHRHVPNREREHAAGLVRGRRQVAGGVGLVPEPPAQVVRVPHRGHRRHRLLRAFAPGEPRVRGLATA